MNEIIITFLVVFAFIGIGYAGAHSNIPAERVYIAIELCEKNGGLEYIDWSNAGCKNGAKISTYRDVYPDEDKQEQSDGL